MNSLICTVDPNYKMIWVLTPARYTPDEVIYGVHKKRNSTKIDDRNEASVLTRFSSSRDIIRVPVL